MRVTQLTSNAKLFKSQFVAKHSAVTPIKEEGPGNCLDAMYAVREIQRARVVTSNIDKRFAK